MHGTISESEKSQVAGPQGGLIGREISLSSKTFETENTWSMEGESLRKGMTEIIYDKLI